MYPLYFVYIVYIYEDLLPPSFLKTTQLIVLYLFFYPICFGITNAVITTALVAIFLFSQYVKDLILLYYYKVLNLIHQPLLI